MKQRTYDILMEAAFSGSSNETNNNLIMDGSVEGTAGEVRLSGAGQLAADKVGFEAMGNPSAAGSAVRRPAKTSCYQNRELSWLKFNERVLEEAESPHNPLCERLNFLAIYQSNLDEFFMVRVGSLHDRMLLKKDERENKTNMTAEEQTDAILEQVQRMNRRKDAAYQALMETVAAEGVRLLTFAEIGEEEEIQLRRYFSREIQPLLSTMVVGRKQPFPFLRNEEIYAVAVLSTKKEKGKLAIIPCSNEVISRLIPIPSRPGCFILAEELILHYLPLVFKKYTILRKSLFRITRNADIDADQIYDEELNYRDHMSEVIRQRRKLCPVRMEISRELSEQIVAQLCKELRIKEAQVFTTAAPMDLSFLYEIQELLRQKETSARAAANPVREPSLAKEGTGGAQAATKNGSAGDQTTTKNRSVEELAAGRDRSSSGSLPVGYFYEKRSPQHSPMVRYEEPILPQILEHDILLSYPYESITPFLRMLNEAAVDPNVVSIKMTLYRLAKNSKVVEALVMAAENDKQVDVLVELKARFDEENNIEWSRRLEDAGCHVIYGLDGLKVHSKLCLITRRNGTVRSEGAFQYITQIGTGNYNEKTSRLYTDLSLMTANEEIGREAAEVFAALLMGETIDQTEHLLVAPKCLQNRVIEMIDEEIREKKEGREAYIGIKINSLTDKQIIDKLIEASEAGVRVDMIIRGINCILSGIPGKTDNIHVISIVGRYLEHSRIYIFGRGERTKLYISSADFMTRNTLRRVEVGVPIYDPQIRERLLEMFDIMLRDNVQARDQMPDGSYVRRSPKARTVANSGNATSDGNAEKDGNAANDGNVAKSPDAEKSGGDEAKSWTELRIESEPLNAQEYFAAKAYEWAAAVAAGQGQ